VIMGKGRGLNEKWLEYLIFELFSDRKWSTRLVWWWRWRCLLRVSLLVGLHIIEGLQHCLHKLILGGDQLFKVDIVVGVVVVAAVGLAVVLAISCVHHLMVW
jgi:hypothetical protein